MSFILFFLIIFLAMSWVINKLLFGNLFSPPTLEDKIKEQKAKEGTIRIYKNSQPTGKPAKPTIQDLGEDVEYEEIKE